MVVVSEPSAALRKSLEQWKLTVRLLQSAFRRRRRPCPTFHFADCFYRRCFCVYWETLRRNTYLTFQHADQTLWILVYSPIDFFGYSSSLSRSTSCVPFCI